MNGLDLAVIGIVVLSTLLAFFRGVVREVIALVTWIAAFGLALALNARVVALLPDFGGGPLARYIVALALVLIAVLVAGAIVAYLVGAAIRAAGLGFVDRFLGAGFGLARGLLVVLIFAIGAGMSTLPKSDWWQNAALGPVLAAAALAARPWLPPAWAGKLDYSPAERKSATARACEPRGWPGDVEESG
jgi:membrane protein required for colicin V production